MCVLRGFACCVWYLLLVCVCVFCAVRGTCPPVTLCTDRRAHASRRGLSEGGVDLGGCALLLSFPFFPPSRPSSPPVLRPSPPLTFRLQVFFLFDSPSALPVLSQHPVICLLWVVLPRHPYFVMASLPSLSLVCRCRCHAARLHVAILLYWSNRRNFSVASQGLCLAPTGVSLPQRSSSTPPSCLRAAGSDRALNHLPLAFPRGTGVC